MVPNLEHILIFKTNISSDSDKMVMRKHFSNIEPIEEWHVDSEDVDCVLRVVSKVLNAADIINELKNIGFDCQELS